MVKWNLKINNNTHRYNSSSQVDIYFVNMTPNINKVPYILISLQI